MVRKLPTFPKMSLKSILKGDRVYYIFGAFLLLVIVMGIGGFGKGGSWFGRGSGGLDFTDNIRTKPNSCYDCEASSTKYPHLSTKTKCFNCEDEVASHSGWSNAGAAQNSKCYDCVDNKQLFRDGILQHKRPIIGS